jgi:hypothetical protein
MEPEKPMLMQSTIELWLLSSEGRNTHDSRGTTEEKDSQAMHIETVFCYNG